MLNLVIMIAADGLAPNGAGPPTNTNLTKLDKFVQSFSGYQININNFCQFFVDQIEGLV